MWAIHAFSSSVIATPSIAASWTARMIPTLWKLALKTVRKLQGQADDMTDCMCACDSDTQILEEQDLDVHSIIKKAAILVVASGVASLANFETFTGYCLSYWSSVADSDFYHSALEGSRILANDATNGDYILQLQQAPRRTSHKSSRWICVGYGRYVIVEDK